jgi:hypothetical protein
MMLSFLDSYLNSTKDASGTEVFHAGNAFTTLQILNLFNLILSFGDEDTHDKFFQHLSNINQSESSLDTYGVNSHEQLAGIVCEITNKCCTFGTANTLIITAAITSMKVLLKCYPFIIWKHLRVLRLLPQNNDFDYTSTSFIQQVVIPAECIVGKYDATLAYLDLVLALVEESQLLSRVESSLPSSDNTDASKLAAEQTGVKAEIISSSVLFIIRELFSSYSSWRYSNIDQKLQIGNKIIIILNTIMEDIMWYNEEQADLPDSQVRISIVQKIIFDSFTKKGANYQIAPLLDIIGLGNETPLRYYKITRLQESEHTEQCIIGALKFLKLILLRLLHRDEGMSALESCIFDRSTRTPSGKHVELIQIIGLYVTYDYARFAIHSTEILNILCSLSNQPRRPTLSFVGYFGGDALTLCSKFVSLVNDKSHYSADDQVVQASIINFATTVIVAQPGYYVFKL